MSRSVPIDVEVTDQFPIWDLDGITKLSGLTPADFNVIIYREGVPQSGHPFTIAEIGSSGEYTFKFTPDALGYWVTEVTYFSLQSQDWSGEYTATIDTFDDLYAMVKRSLGLLHENSLIDEVIPDPGGTGQAISARLRVYDTKANAEAAKATSPAGGTTGLLQTYEIVATYDGVMLETYTFTRVGS